MEFWCWNAQQTANSIAAVISIKLKSQKKAYRQNYLTPCEAHSTEANRCVVHGLWLRVLRQAPMFFSCPALMKLICAPSPRRKIVWDSAHESISLDFGRPITLAQAIRRPSGSAPKATVLNQKPARLTKSLVLNQNSDPTMTRRSPAKFSLCLKLKIALRGYYIISIILYEYE